MAVRTCDGSTAPEEQAAPTEQAKPFKVERDDEGFAFDPCKHDVGCVRRARSGGSVHADLRNALEQAAFEFVAQCRDSVRVAREGIARDFRGFAEADDSGDVFRAGAEAALVMAAVEKLAEARAAADIESADAFWCVELVAREREQIDV